VRLAVNKYRPVKSRAIEVTTSLLEKGDPPRRQHSGYIVRVYTATPIGSAANTNAIEIGW